jgi:hypothetical protein
MSTVQKKSNCLQRGFKRTNLWLAQGSVLRHVGVFCLLLSVTFLLVRFTPIPTETWYAMPALFLAYISMCLIARGTMRRR